MKGTASFVEGRVRDDSIWAVLHRECHVLFPDVLFVHLDGPAVGAAADRGGGDGVAAPVRSVGPGSGPGL